MSTQDTDDFNCINNNSFTSSYRYPSQDQEFIFTCKGRPFATLVFSSFPAPTSNLLDFDLIQKLGLKMTDVQCRKFYFAGSKFRILGRVSTAVQCVQDGRISNNNFHIKGFVVSDLYQTLDSHCIAGNKMKQFLLQTGPGGGRDNDLPGAGGRDNVFHGAGGRDIGSPGARGRDIGPPGAGGRDIGPPIAGGRDNGPPGAGGRDNGPPGAGARDNAPPGAGGRDNAPPGAEGHDNVPYEAGGRNNVPYGAGGCDNVPLGGPANTNTRHDWQTNPEAWPGGVGSKMRIPWCHPDADKVPWLVDDAVSFRIMCVNGIPSHYARVTCIKCDTWIDEDSTRDPGIQRCTNCWIEKEIKKRKKMLNR